MSSMEAIPNEAQAKRDLLEKGVQELMMLKEQVSMKRRQLKVMGLMEEPEVYKKTVKYPDLQVKYKQQKEQKATAKPAEAPAPVVAPTPKASVPADSPFMDPKAPASKQEAPKQEPVKHQEAVPTPAPVAVVSAPIPVPVKAAPVEVKPMRIGLDGRWLW